MCPVCPVCVLSVVEIHVCPVCVSRLPPVSFYRYTVSAKASAVVGCPGADRLTGRASALTRPCLPRLFRCIVVEARVVLK